MKLIVTSWQFVSLFHCTHGFQSEFNGKLEKVMTCGLEFNYM